MKTISLEANHPHPANWNSEREATHAPCPTARVLLGIERNRTTPPEVHPERAVAVTRSYLETEGQSIFTRRGKMLLRIAA